MHIPDEDSIIKIHINNFIFHLFRILPYQFENQVILFLLCLIIPLSDRSKTKSDNSYEIFARFDIKSDKVNVSEEELCTTEKEAIARVTELNKDNREYPELD